MKQQTSPQQLTLDGLPSTKVTRAQYKSAISKLQKLGLSPSISTRLLEYCDAKTIAQDIKDIIYSIKSKQAVEVAFQGPKIAKLEAKIATARNALNKELSKLHDIKSHHDDMIQKFMTMQCEDLLLRSQVVMELSTKILTPKE